MLMSMYGRLELNMDSVAHLTSSFNGIYYLGHMSAMDDVSTASKSKRQRTGHKSEARVAHKEV